MMLLGYPYVFFVVMVLIITNSAAFGNHHHQNGGDIMCPNPDDIAPCTCELLDNIYGPPSQMNCYKITTDILEKVLSVDFPNDIARLEVKGSNLNNLSAISFGVKSFEEVYLVGNHISSLDRDTFSLSKEKLTFISLGDNQIESVRFQDLSYYPNLEILHLFNNHISSVDGLIGLPLNSPLRDLRLNANRISTITHETFFSLSNLQNLDLSWNFLTTLPSLAFMPLSKLEILNLKGNSLTTLPATSLWLSTPIIRSIYLNRNKIETVEEDAFLGIDYDTYIDLAVNELKEITLEAFGPLLYTLSQGWGILDVSVNHLRCNCDLLWFLIEDSYERHITYYFCYKLLDPVPHPINDKLIQELIEECQPETTVVPRLN